MAVEDCALDCDERDACPDAGQAGHWYCGHCADCDKPRHHCGHGLLPDYKPMDSLDSMTAAEVQAALEDFLRGTEGK